MKDTAQSPFMHVTIQVPTERIANLITSAIEGYSNYWLRHFRLTSEYTGEVDCNWYSTPAFWAGLYRIAATEFDENTGEETKHDLIRHDMRKALRKMASDHPHHFADMLSENDDAITGDILMQLFVLGEVRYG